MELTDEIVKQVTDLLGRNPRGLRAVEVVNDAGEPSVIRVASVVDYKPFPTLFWLIDRTLCYRIDQLEASGLIRILQDQVDEDTTLRDSMLRDHTNYIKMYDNKIVLNKNQKGKAIVRKLFKLIKSNPRKFLTKDQLTNDKYRAISDFISGMTDRYAINLYNENK